MVTCLTIESYCRHPDRSAYEGIGVGAGYRPSQSEETAQDHGPSSTLPPFQSAPTSFPSYDTVHSSAEHRRRDCHYQLLNPDSPALERSAEHPQTQAQPLPSQEHPQRILGWMESKGRCWPVLLAGKTTEPSCSLVRSRIWRHRPRPARIHVVQRRSQKQSRYINRYTRGGRCPRKSGHTLPHHGLLPSRL
jgi:hypothetical protein